MPFLDHAARRGPTRIAVGVGALGLTALLAACTSGGEPAGQSSAASAGQTSGSGSAPATPSPTPEPPPDSSPLSGRAGGVGTPVMVVKLDNTPSAQPHRGLTSADMVYVEPVEWGLTRLAAVYSTDFPGTVGPVRSARIGDIELFAPLGDIAFVYSGSQRRLQPKIVAADWTPVSPDLDSPGFHRERGTGRYAPFNLMADQERILETAGATAVSQDIGLAFDEEPVLGGTKATRVTATWPSTRIQFRWNRKKDAYDVWMHGQPARDTDDPGVQRATTVIVQYVKQVDSGYGDKFGGRTPLTITTGRGKGLLLRDGRSHRITWERPQETAPTAYLDAGGQPVVLAPGQVWILLMDKSRKVIVE